MLTVSSGDLQRCMELISTAVAKSVHFSYRPPEKSVRLAFETKIEDFLNRNRPYLSAENLDIDALEQDAALRMTDYYREVHSFVEEDLSQPLRIIKEKLLSENIEDPDCYELFARIRSIVTDFLLEVFIKNERQNFEKIIFNVLRRFQWKKKVKMPFLKAKLPAVYGKFVEILKVIYLWWSRFIFQLKVLLVIWYMLVRCINCSGSWLRLLMMGLQ